MRILNIKETYGFAGDNKTIHLTVNDENGKDLQGTITIDNIDKVEFKPISYPNENITPDTNSANNISPKYYVYNPAEQKPKVLYNTFEEAERNARLVANKYKDCTVYVLQVVEQITRTSIVKDETLNYMTGKTDELLDKIPF